MNQIPFEQLTYARFSALEKKRFRVQADAANWIELELTSLKQYPSPRPASAESGPPRNECFSLTFNGPASRFLEQKVHHFEHDELGAFSLFVVPIGKTPEAFQYEVIINRLG